LAGIAALVDDRAVCGITEQVLIADAGGDHPCLAEGHDAADHDAGGIDATIGLVAGSAETGKERDVTTADTVVGVVIVITGKTDTAADVHQHR